MSMFKYRIAKLLIAVAVVGAIAVVGCTGRATTLS
jgi:hypothetical protein